MGKNRILTALLWIMPCALLLAVHVDKPTRVFVVQYASYVIIAASILFALVVIFKFFAIKQLIRTYYLGIVSGAALAVASSFLIPPNMRLLHDEALLAASARSMMTGSTEIAINTMLVGGTIDVREIILPVKPQLFPFLTGLSHWLLGYSAFNGIVVNLCIWALVLAVLFAVGKKLFGTGAGFAVQILAASQPVFVLHATSGALDMTALLFVIFLITACWFFFETPGTLRFLMLVVAGAFLVNSRYESLVYALPLCVLLWTFGYLDRARIKAYGWCFLVGLWMIVPALAQRALKPDERGWGATLPADGMFSVNYIGRNVSGFFESHFTPLSPYPYAGVVNFVALIGAVYLGYAWVRQRGHLSMSTWKTFAVAGCCLAAHWLLFMAFWSGSPRSPVGVRFYMPEAVAMTVICLVFIWSVAKPSWLRWVLVAALAASSAAKYRDPGILALSEPAEKLRSLTAYLATHDKGNLQLVVDESPYYAMQGYAAVTFPFAKAHWAEIMENFAAGSTQRLLIVTEGALDRVPRSSVQIFQDAYAPGKAYTVYEVQR